MRNLKKFFSLFLVLVLAFTVFGCNNSNVVKTPVESEVETVEEKKQIIVFAAASMTETLSQIAEEYKKENANLDIQFNFDSSGTLKTQIEEGAECDMFISAAPKQMNQLDKGTDTESGLNMIDSSTRFNLLENKVALSVTDKNEKNIDSFNTLVEKLKSKNVLLAIGNSDVPVGQYTQKIFKYFDLNEEDLAKDGVLTYGSNVKEVTTQVKEEVVDCGIIYQTDAYSAGLKVVDTATKDMCGQVIYPAAILKNSKNQNEAKKFLDYLKSDTAKKIFESVGFTPLV